MGAWPSKGTATPATSRAIPPWSALPPELANLVLRHLPSDADRVCFGAVCRHWRHHVGRKISLSRWSGLPSDLVDLVLRRLYSHADRVRFAAVCRHWRHVAGNYSSPPLPPALPWICSSDGVCKSLPDGEVHRLRFRDGVSCYGSFGDWLLFKEIGLSNRFLENPLSGATVQLPGQLYDSRRCSSDPESEFFDILKVIVCSNDLIAAMIRYGDHHSGAVACCRPGMPTWSRRRRCSGLRYQDMAFHEGNLYAVAIGGELFVHEVNEDSETGEPRVSQAKQVLQSPPICDGFPVYRVNCSRCHLVISTGKLLLVRWFLPPNFLHSSRELVLQVFEADFEMEQWLEVESLEDQVLFVSSNCSKAMSPSTHGDCLKANKIYLIDENVMFWKFRVQRCSSACMYDMRSQTIELITLDERMSYRSEVAWFYPLSISS